MKSREEIEKMIATNKEDYAYLETWHAEAEERYSNNRKMWGNEADDGELRTVNGLISERRAELRVLEWVLRDDNQNNITHNETN